jgi:hypothetical protein
VVNVERTINAKKNGNGPVEDKSYAVFNIAEESTKIQSIRIDYEYVEAYEGKSLYVLTNDDFPRTKGNTSVSLPTKGHICTGEIIMLYPKPTRAPITLKITPKTTITSVHQLYYDGNEWLWFKLTETSPGSGSWPTEKPLDCMFCVT